MKKITVLQRKALLNQVTQEGNLAIQDSDQDLMDLRKNLEIGLLNLNDVKNIWNELQDRLVMAERAADKLRDMGYSITDGSYYRNGDGGTHIKANGKAISISDASMLTKQIEKALQPLKELKRGLSEKMSHAQTDIIMCEDIETAKKAIWDFQTHASNIQDEIGNVIKKSEVVRA